MDPANVHHGDRRIRYAPRVAGKRWEPETDEQAAKLAEIVAGFEAARAAMDRAWKLAAEGVALGVPKRRIALDTGIGTATVDRRLGPQGASG